MLFNSFSYAIFLPIVFILYWIIPSRYRWGLLLIASYIFYMSWNPTYAVLILYTTIVSYSASLLIERTKHVVLKRMIVTIGLVLCLSVLFVFKYYNFVLGTIVHFIDFEPQYMNLLLPVGISFYTFQTLSYVIDVYRGEIPADKHLGIYATFVSFFPQLVAGPIERSSNLLPQIRDKHVFNEENAYYGIRLILWGLFKKMLIADNLAVYVDMVYADIYSYTGGSILIATIFFTFQIYCDFSGYSDIARGSAKLLGIDLMENFKSPYFSTSIKDFWGRWHISLSSWFRDYLYIPMGGNRVSKTRNCINVMITFLVSGLWHGANWNFVVWGGIHGLALVYENAFGINAYDENNIFIHIRRIVVFVFVSFAWIFFRAPNLNSAVSIIHGILTSHGMPFMDTPSIVNGVIAFCILLLKDLHDEFNWKFSLIDSKTIWISHLSIAALICFILLFGVFDGGQFIYFQF